MRAVVLVNGVLGDAAQARKLALQADLLVAANGGSRNAFKLGLAPDLVVGDLDSLDAPLREYLEQGGAEIVQHPAEKDETDLELALLQAAQRGADEIVVLTALGGRTDQMLANILLLNLPELQRLHVWMVEGVETISFITEAAEMVGEVGDLLSLIPIGGDCHGIWTEGLQYVLADDSLVLARARGISNVFTNTRACVRVTQGTLLAIHRAQAPVMAWPEHEKQAS